MTDKTARENIAKRRILALHQMAQINARQTGGDPAEAVFELLVAACMLAGHNMRDRSEALDLITQILPAAARCAEGWFPLLSHPESDQETVQ